MKKLFDDFKNWYAARKWREKLLTLLLACATLYAMFSAVIFQNIAAKKTAYKIEIAATKKQIQQWRTQIKTLKKIPNTPLFKEWMAQNQSLKKLNATYKSLLQMPPEKQWQDIVATLLQSENAISLVEIKSSPEIDYNSTEASIMKNKIFQQKLLLTIYANYFDTIAFLDKFEQSLPNLHWDTLNYEVVQYPIAKIQMEFSILYEKS